MVAWQTTTNPAHCSAARCLLCASAVNASHGRASHSVIFVPSVISMVKPLPVSIRYTKIHETTVENRQLIEDKARAHFYSLRNSTFLKIRRRPDEGLRPACSEARREVVFVCEIPAPPASTTGWKFGRAQKLPRCASRRYNSRMVSVKIRTCPTARRKG